MNREPNNQMLAFSVSLADDLVICLNGNPTDRACILLIQFNLIIPFITTITSAVCRLSVSSAVLLYVTVPSSQMRKVGGECGLYSHPAVKYYPRVVVGRSKSAQRNCLCPPLLKTIKIIRNTFIRRCNKIWHQAARNTLEKAQTWVVSRILPGK